MRARHPALVAALAALVALAAAAACRPSRTSEAIIPIDVTDAAAPSTPAPVAAVDASAAPVALPAAGGAPTSVWYVLDGTLLMGNDKQLVARAPDGTLQRKALAHSAVLHTSTDLAGVIVEEGERIRLLATPSLAVLYEGKGTLPFGSEGVIVIDDGAAVVFQHAGKLTRLALPKALKNPRLETVRPMVNGTRLNVTVASDGPGDSMITNGYLFDAQSGTVIGRGIPLVAVNAEGPRGAHAGEIGFTIEAGSRVTRVDLKTAKVVRQGVVRCGKDIPFANPTPNANGSLLLVTCGGDAVVLDGVTLAERRRIKDVMPGCDNGNVLGGDILADGHTLRLEGCGGEARVDLNSGKYVCGDGAGIVGGPYGGMAPPGPGGTSSPQAPSGRASLPLCTKDLSRQTSAFGHTGRYRLVLSEHQSIEHAGGLVDLEEESTGFPVVAADESSFAYVLGNKVIVRGLPDGKLKLELTPFAP